MRFSEFHEFFNDEKIFVTSTTQYEGTTELVVTENASPLEVPLYGFPGWVFYVIHGVAIVSLVTSILISAGLIIYMARSSQENFAQKQISERLVVYLAICDLGWSSSHLMVGETYAAFLQDVFRGAQFMPTNDPKIFVKGSPGPLEQRSWVLPCKIMRFAIQGGELLWRINLIKIWHTYVPKTVFY